MVPSIAAALGRWRDRGGGRKPDEAVVAARRRAGAAVVTLDNAIRTSSDELAVAEREFGRTRTQPFRESLASARALSEQAFDLQHESEARIRAGVDEEVEEYDRLTRVIDLAAEADAVLEAQREEFVALRRLRELVPQMLDDLAVRAEEVAGEIPAAEATLVELRSAHPEGTLVPVASAVAEARDLVAAAARLVRSGQEHLVGGHRGAAVSAARAAEDALGHARDEVMSVDRLRDALATAAHDLEAALASINSDIDDAARLAATDPVTTAARARAEAAIAAAERARDEGGDVLAALAELEDAERELDEALAARRDEKTTRVRRLTRAERRLRNTRAFVDRVDSRLTHTKGVVTARARTDVSRAQRQVTRASELVTSDPERAEQALDEARRLATDAEAVIERDIADFALPGLPLAEHPGSMHIDNAEIASGILTVGLLGAIGLGLGGGGGGGDSGSGGGGRF